MRIGGIISYVSKWVVLSIAMLIFSACSLTKHVPAHQHLLSRLSVSSDVPAVSSDVARQYIRQKTNSRILGFVPLSLSIYSLSGSDTSKWINRVLQNAGEPPVVYDPNLTFQSVANLTQLLRNKGYASARVSADTTQYSKKKLKVTYNLKGGEPYRIRHIDYLIDDDTLRQFIFQDSVSCTLHEGDRFDMDALKAERLRIVTSLRQRGFYYLNPEHLFIEADTTVGNLCVDITFRDRPVTLNNPSGVVDTLVHHPRLKIRNVNFFPWLYTSEGVLRNQIRDSLKCGNVNFYYGFQRRICPSTVYMKSHVLPGRYYNESDVLRTNTSLASLPTTKYASVSFQPVRGAQDSLLDAFVIISPNRMRSYSVEVEGTNTDGDIGAAVNGTYTYRNLFRSANTFNFKTRFAYQPMGNLGNLLSDRTIDVGSEVSITFPRVLFPFLSDNLRRRIRANTVLSLSSNWQTTPWYNRYITTAQWQYAWTTGSKNTERYTITPFDLSYVYLPTISDYFRHNYLGANSVIRYSYEDHIILSAGFSFSRHNHTRPNTNYFSYRGSFEAAGNALQALCSISGRDKDTAGYYTLLDIRFSQYVKGEFDYSFCQILGQKSNVVYHFRVGAAYPYGNADVVPFEKRFYAGGANSVRGWSVRTLGPGVYKRQGSGVDLMQAGDLALDLNLEYRFKLFWLLEGAAFLDAGNVWTIHDYRDQPGGQFGADTFYEQLAAAYGLGLRLDFSFFILRCDVGAKLHDPGEENGHRWCHPFNINDMALHLAIGYPF